MPKASAEGVARLAAWHRESAGTELPPAEAKELLERAAGSSITSAASK